MHARRVSTPQDSDGYRNDAPVCVRPARHAQRMTGTSLQLGPLVDHIERGVARLRGVVRSIAIAHTGSHQWLASLRPASAQASVYRVPTNVTVSDTRLFMTRKSFASGHVTLGTVFARGAV